MGGHRNDPKAKSKTPNTGWDDVLNFGPENTEKNVEDLGVKDRLKRLVKQLEDLNKRMDRLNHNDHF